MTKKIPINIWDDYDDESSYVETYAYVDDLRIDYDFRLSYLEEFSVLFSEAVKGSNIEFGLVHYDSRTRYPMLPESMHFTSPRLNIKNMNHEQREAIVNHFQTIESNFDVYSES